MTYDGVFLTVGKIKSSVLFCNMQHNNIGKNYLFVQLLMKGMLCSSFCLSTLVVNIYQVLMVPYSKLNTNKGIDDPIHNYKKDMNHVTH